MSGPSSCDECLRRAWLIGSLADSIEGALEGRPGGDTRSLLGLDEDELAAAVAGRRAASFAASARERDAACLREAVRGARCWACCRHDESYPESLRELPDAPAVLFGRGDRLHLSALTGEAVVTVVGARRPSAYGRERAQALGDGLARAGVPVVSGMAFGVDSCAHAGALEAGGLTVAVLGGGPELATPSGMTRLYERITAEGLVLSELPPGTTPRRWTFPARNRIMAALSRMTVVVEARHRSGSLITSGMAGDLGREVGAVPGQVGNPAADGTNDLLHEGAHVVREPADVLDALLGPGHRRAAGSRERSRLDPRLAAVLERIEMGATGQDAVARECGLDAAAAGAALARLELAGLVRSDSAGRYRPAGG